MTQRPNKGVDPAAWGDLDFRPNLIVDANNPILIMRAWRDHQSPGGEAYLGVTHGEDALTWNVFRSLQSLKRLDPVSEFFDIGSPIEEILFWGCDAEGRSESQQALSCLIRMVDGRRKGTMTEIDLVLITAGDVCSVECKVKSNRFPWQAQGEGWKSRLRDYKAQLPWGFEALPESPDEVEIRRRFYQLTRNAVYSSLLAQALKKKTSHVTSLVDRNVYSRYPEIHETYAEFQRWCDFCHVLDIRFWQDLAEYDLPSNVLSKMKKSLG
jgi:hypothetical protein